MKRIFLLLALLIILVLTAWFLKERSDTDDIGVFTKDRAFAVSNLDDISMITIKHKKLPVMYFTKKDKSWILNNKYNVDPAVFVNVERVLTNMKLKYTPPKASTPTIIKSIASSGIEVELYSTRNEKPIKSFFIGTDNQQGDGTFFLLKGYDQPYVMHLPGLSGGLRSRFEQPFQNYRDKRLYTSNSEDIVNIKVSYPKQMASSFNISQSGETLNIEPLVINAKIKDKQASEAKLKRYLNGFSSLGAEGIYNDLLNKDTIINSVPFCIIDLESKTGTISSLKYYVYDEFTEKKFLARGPEDIKEIERFFVLSTENDLFLTQNKVFGHIFRGYEDFYK